ncbi:MAG: hypothetical protein ACOX34_04575 [Bacillota bacterium]|jgi:hypothetical protein|nr:hypothetical protein [Candidatus Fermentithermobacillaceae bacterium]
MATIKTKTTELSVACGILEHDVLSILSDELPFLFNNTVDEKTLIDVQREYVSPSNHSLYSSLWAQGKHLRANYEPFNSVSNVSWTGGLRQSSTVSASKDLVVAGTSVSVKGKSNVIYNLSPTNLFEQIPSGQLMAAHSENWFLKLVPKELNDLYKIASRYLPSLPDDVETFEGSATSTHRQILRDHIANSSRETQESFSHKYLEMCHKVAEISSNMFNTNFERAFCSASRSALVDSIIKIFFRLDSSPYLLVSLDWDGPLSQVIPSITEWKQHHQFVSLVATPNLSKKQSVVDFILTIRENSTRQDRSYKFHAEIRWSHGRFCGNPEAKLYKDFPWRAVSFLETL